MSEERKRGNWTNAPRDGIFRLSRRTRGPSLCMSHPCTTGDNKNKRRLYCNYSRKSNTSLRKYCSVLQTIVSLFCLHGTETKEKQRKYVIRKWGFPPNATQQAKTFRGNRERELGSATVERVRWARTWKVDCATAGVRRYSGWWPGEKRWDGTVAVQMWSGMHLYGYL